MEDKRRDYPIQDGKGGWDGNAGEDMALQGSTEADLKKKSLPRKDFSKQTGREKRKG